MAIGEEIRGVRGTGGSRRMNVAVSPEGTVLAPGTEAFFERIGYANPDFDAGDYVVRNLGFVSVARRSRDRVTVRMRPSLVSDRALDSVLKILVNLKFNQGEIQVFDDEWVSEVWPNDPALLHRIAEICASKPVSKEPRFGARRLDIERIVDDATNPLKPLFQKWRISDGMFDDTTMPFLINFGLDFRLSVVTAERVGEPLRFQFFGDGFKFYDDQQKLSVIGCTLDDQPDAEYGEWLAAQYNAVVETGRPALDYVTATIQPAGGAARRSRYERLLLPWRTGNGRVIVTCASILISTIAGEELESGALPGSRLPLHDEVAQVAE